MICRRGSVFRGHCGSQLIFNREDKVEAIFSSRYSTKSEILYFTEKINNHIP